MSTIYIVDDETNIRSAMSKVLSSLGHKVFTAASAEEALAKLAEVQPDLVVMDVQMSGMSGLDAIRKLKAILPKLPIIIMTGQGTTEIAIEATKNGAFDYHLKPFEPQEMIKSINHALDSIRLMAREVEIAPAVQKATSDALIGQSHAMQEVYKAIGRVAGTDATVLIRGETGTGKELVARALYQHSARSAQPLMVVNCVAIPETLLESELFGHEKGAFTGADSKRIGRFEQCSGGTLFLDEVGDMTPLVQSKLLRLLQEQKFERVGGSETISTDVRILAATNRDLEKMVADGDFRADLYYRLNGYTIKLPPLRERGDDLIILLEHFLSRFANSLGKDVEGITPEALDLLAKYPWPGNVRELQSVVRQSLLHATGRVLMPDFLPEEVRRGRKPLVTAGPSRQGGLRSLEMLIDDILEGGGEELYAESLAMLEKYLFTRVLSHTGGNQS
ncbi:MAG TPA: sigma-54 dependent transcriptional regulator, partial [Planctomycetota bacterium]|nr:sigma-54 dependent transcriptional regulator [Planctomycetota bacterium]